MQTAAFVLAAPLPCPRARPTRRRARPVQAARPRATRARSSAALDGADDARARLEAALRRELPCFFQRGLRGLVGSLWAGAGAGGFASDVEILFPFVERLVGWPSLWFILVFIHRLTVWHTLNAKIDVESIAFEAVGEHLLVCTYNIYTDVAETVAENESDPEWLAAAASLASSRIEGTAPVVAVTVRTNVHFELASGKISCWEESYSLTQLQYFRLFLDAMNKEEELIAKRMHHLRNQNPGVRRGPSAEGALPLERSAYDKRVAEIVHFLRNDFPRHLYPAAPLPASDEAEGTVSGSAATPLDYSLFDDLVALTAPVGIVMGKDFLRMHHNLSRFILKLCFKSSSVKFARFESLPERSTICAVYHTKALSRLGGVVEFCTRAVFTVSDSGLILFQEDDYSRTPLEILSSHIKPRGTWLQKQS